MKFENNIDSSIEFIGNIQENEVSIDAKDLDFIIKILSTNLYSNPIGSLLRENISNAWDSHVEAGVDLPVILQLFKDSEDRMYCKISDNGVGISEERFETVYRKIGSSTKREDNTAIGGFGIGKYSTLAYSDLVNITSYYNGIAYEYVMLKEFDKLKINKIHQYETDRHNGVEILIEIKSRNDYIKFKREAIKQLIFFENLYVSDEIKTVDPRSINYQIDPNLNIFFENLKIKFYKNFAVHNLKLPDVLKQTYSVVLGKVLYPMDVTKLEITGSNSAYLNFLIDENVCMTFDIGDLDVTPNREELQYTDRTLKKLNDKFNAFVEEIKGIIKNQENMYFDNFADLGKYLTNPLDTVTLFEKDENLNKHYFRNVEISCDKISTKKVFYKGEKLTDDFINTATMLSRIFNDSLRELNYYSVQNNQIRNGSNIYYAPLFKNLSLVPNSENGEIINCKVSKLNRIAKAYLRENYEKAILIDLDKKPIFYYRYLMGKLEKKEKYKYSYRGIENKISVKDKLTREIIYFIVRENIKNSNFEVFNNNSVPKEYIQEHKDRNKPENVVKKSYNKKFTYSEIVNNSFSSKNLYVKKNVTTELKDFKENLIKDKLMIFNKNSKSIVDSKTSFLKILTQNLSNADYKVEVYEIAITRFKWIKDLRGVVDADEVLENLDYAFIRDFFTCYHMYKQLPEIFKIVYNYNRSDIRRVSNKMYDILLELQILFYKCGFSTTKGDLEVNYNEKLNEVYNKVLEKNLFNHKYLALFNKNKEKLANLQIIQRLSYSNYSYHLTKNLLDNIDICIDYIKARKLFYVNLETLKNLKQEEKTIFKP